jgi:hypothetical protein
VLQLLAADRARVQWLPSGGDGVVHPSYLAARALENAGAEREVRSTAAEKKLEHL